MGFEYVSIRSFRNLKDQDLDISHRNIYLVGKNGQGKTNFLELIYYLCYGSSFRTKNDKILIREGKSNFFISAKFNRNSDIIPDSIKIYLDNNQKKIQLNGKTVTDRKDIISSFPCVIFCHNDLYFVNGSPDKKRIYMDQCVSLNNPLFINNLRNYKKILKERNILLKNKNKEMMEVYNYQLIETGFPIQEKREELVSYLNKSFGNLFKEITGLDIKLDIVYNSSWKSREKNKILSEILKKESKEYQYGLTLSGPHRDSFSIILNNSGDFLNFASTGQLRIISLILRILQSRYYSISTGKFPILLVDDVLLELDKDKREKIMEFFPEYEQIFYTFLTNEMINFQENSIHYSVIDGILAEK